MTILKAFHQRIPPKKTRTMLILNQIIVWLLNTHARHPNLH